MKKKKKCYNLLIQQVSLILILLCILWIRVSIQDPIFLFLTLRSRPFLLNIVGLEVRKVGFRKFRNFMDPCGHVSVICSRSKNHCGFGPMLNFEYKFAMFFLPKVEWTCCNTPVIRYFQIAPLVFNYDILVLRL